MSLWTSLCALVHSYVGTGTGHPQTVPTMLWARNCPTSLGMLKHSEFLSLELRGQAQLLKNNPTPQVSQTSTVLLATVKPRLIHQIARWRSAVNHSRECLSTALDSSGGMLYTTASDPLHCTCWCMAWMQLLCSAMETHSMKLSTRCSWANLKATGSLEVCSICWPRSVILRGLPLRGWVAVSPNHFHFVIIPLTVDCGIFRSEEISQVASYHRTQWNSLSSWERPILSHMFVETFYMPRCLLLYTCWPWKWLQHLISIIWMGEWILLAI